MTSFEYLNTVWKSELKGQIKELCEQENSLRHALANPQDDILWVQFGGPLKASQMRYDLQMKRVALEEVYYRVFDEVFEYRVFNEF